MSGSLAFVFGLPLAVVVFFFALAAYERRTGVAVGGGFFQRNGLAIGLYLVLAVGFWAFFIILLPQLAMVDMSFRPKLPPSQMGGPKDLYTLENYRYFLFGSTTSTAEWNWLHIKAFFLTIGVSIVITLINFAICYPLAFHMAQSATAARLRVLLLLLILPYWVNEILRAFAFRVLLSSGGIINQMLMGSGLTNEPIDFLGADVGLYMGLSYAYLLMMIFPLYNAIESLDKNQVEAARDLGAPWWHIHAFIVLPHAKPGIASGCTLVFMLTAGALAAPLVLGGPRTLWFTPIVYDRFYQAFNWPQGAAYAFILLVSCIIFVLVVLKAFRLSLGEITR
ncbi:ABC transporter permease [Ancylobacter rudongensis]|jgi:spermidine/putrescine transport system permease protein|uniref:Spermidine/putrescine transport system permease protein n=1 Tax=Ancylobacter rudongensis TaxID=177413 RepID=A0A1G4U6V1_9HYPH|nr:ABC transporter permease [Ancylobacter rudongensis]RTL93066.1 ABC transporter permease [Ancylobacter aquaticus]SCW89317.1 spermidine/putrescine transport system permease protein [Ancylobacter rudongensis]